MRKKIDLLEGSIAGTLARLAFPIMGTSFIQMGYKDKYHYYEFKSGDIRTRYADTADGLCKSAVNNMAAYADDISCAD